MATPSVPQKICVLHVGHKESHNSEIYLSQESTLKVCQEAHPVHKARQNSKFKNIVLPLNPSEFLGYHSNCYKNFTAVSTQQKLNAAQKLNEQAQHSSSQEHSISLPPAGINNNTFIFCLCVKAHTLLIKNLYCEIIIRW